MYGLRTLTLHWTLVKDTTLKQNELYTSETKVFKIKPQHIVIKIANWMWKFFNNTLKCSSTGHTAFENINNINGKCFLLAFEHWNIFFLSLIMHNYMHNPISAASACE